MSACSFTAAYPTSSMARTTSVTLTLVMLLLAAAGAAPEVGRYSAAADVGRYKVLSFKKGVGPGTGCPDPDGPIGEPGCPNDCSFTCRQAGRRALRNRGGGMVCTDDLNNFDCKTGAPAGSRCNASLTWLRPLKHIDCIGQVKSGYFCGEAAIDFSCCCATEPLGASPPS